MPATVAASLSPCTANDGIPGPDSANCNANCCIRLSENSNCWRFELDIAQIFVWADHFWWNDAILEAPCDESSHATSALSLMFFFYQALSGDESFLVNLAFRLLLSVIEHRNTLIIVRPRAWGIVELWRSSIAHLDEAPCLRPTIDWHCHLLGISIAYMVKKDVRETRQQTSWRHMEQTVYW